MMRDPLAAALGAPSFPRIDPLAMPLGASDGYSSRRQQLADLRAIQSWPQTVGYYDPSQPVYTNTGDASPAAVGAPVGVAYDQSKGLVLGPELVGSMSDGSGWVLGAGVTISNGNIVINAIPTNTNIAASVSINVSDTAKSFLVSYDMVSITSGAIALGVMTYWSDAIYRSSIGRYKSVIVGYKPTFGFISAGGTTSATINNLSVREILGGSATQLTTANKPLLRRTPITGKYWLDADATDALNLALPAQLTNAAIFRATAEGVTVQRGQTVATNFNIVTPYSFNGPVAIFNEALGTLTDAQIATMTRVLSAGVPALGPELLLDTEFDDASKWALTTATIQGGVLTLSGSPSFAVAVGPGLAPGALIQLKSKLNSIVSGDYYVGIGPSTGAEQIMRPNIYSIGINYAVGYTSFISSFVRVSRHTPITNGVIEYCSLKSIL